MKITRLKRGYRIRLSDTEFHALTEVVEQGLSDIQGVDMHEEYGIPARIANLMPAMGLSPVEDRRG